MRKFLIVKGFFMLLIPVCLGDSVKSTINDPPDHQRWSQLLSRHVDHDGFVDYQGFIRDSLALYEYLEELKNHAPDKQSWTREEQLAYWINTYNAFTIKLIIDHYPVESIKDIGSFIQIPFINTPWDIKFIEIGGRKYDLNNIEHGILRKEFDEPRIHFAIVCASMSCPKLRREAYTPAKLEEQLQEQAITFLNDPQKNKFDTEMAEISKIFNWFRSDFTNDGSLIEFLNQFTEAELDDQTKITYMDYDWSLNEK